MQFEVCRKTLEKDLGYNIYKTVIYFYISIYGLINSKEIKISSQITYTLLIQIHFELVEEEVVYVLVILC